MHVTITTIIMTVIIKQCKNDYQIKNRVSNFEIVKIAYITSHRFTPTQKHIPMLDRIHVMYVVHQIELGLSSMLRFNVEL